MSSTLTPPRTAEAALHAHGFTGDRLLKLAHRIANDWLRQHGATVGSRYEDLVSFLILHACKAAINYDTTRTHTSYGTNGGDPFASYLADILDKRCTDWYRSKAEGFGDARYGNNNRLILTDTDDDPDPDVDFGTLVSEKRLGRWQHAATSVGWNFPDWVCITLDRAAAQIERTAA